MMIFQKSLKFQVYSFYCQNSFVRKWFEPRSSIPWLKKIIWVIGVLRRTVVSDWRFDNLCGSHLQSQVVVLVSWKFKNPGEWFDWSIDRVAVGKYVMWLAVKTCAEIGYANRWSNRLWRWLPHRLSKRQSLTTVFLRTPITQMIFFNQGKIHLILPLSAKFQ